MYNEKDYPAYVGYTSWKGKLEEVDKQLMSRTLRFQEKNYSVEEMWDGISAMVNRME